MSISKKTLLMAFCYLALQNGLIKANPMVEIDGYVQQQTNKKISGAVIDSSGEPVIGANVVVKGTTNGVITDLDGNFVLNAKKGDVIEVSFIGFMPQTFKVDARAKYKITLKDDTQVLNEVVVVGYGVQSKKSIVGAISQTDSKELMKSGGVTSVGEALQGKMPGVTAIYTSGRPGEKDMQLYIRGQSSWNGGGQPLVMIDGVEGNINDLDMNEVDNISVLKDASATAVYGVKGANGVILITTKRGQTGKADISISANVTFKGVSKIPGQLDAYDAQEMTNSAILNEVAYNENSWKSYKPSQLMDMYRNQTTQDQKERFPNINWSDYLLKDVASDQRVNFSVRGGTNSVKYFCNLSYQHEDDLFKKFNNGKGYDSSFDYNRFNYRSNLDFDITKTTKFAVNVSGSYGVSKRPNAKEEYFMYNGLYGLGPSVFYPLFEDGSYGYETTGSFELRNPVADLSSGGTRTTNKLSLITDFTLNQDLGFIIKGLSLKGHLSINNVTSSHSEIYDGGTSQQYVSKTFINDGQDPIYKYSQGFASDYAFTPDPWTLSNYIIDDYSRERRTTYDLALNYKNTFGKHGVSALALFKREEYTYGSMFPTYREDWVGRVTYDYASKYFFEANGAYNGSEKFGPGYRFDLFPSVALGWLVSEEKFMKGIKWIDKLKIRGSYGLVGDDSYSGRWKYMTQWDSYNTYIWMNKFTYDNTRYSPYVLYKEAVLGNADLHWEKSTKKDLGLELGVLKNMFTLEFDYFTENRSDIIINSSDRAIPSWFGASAPDINLGKVDVKGYEFILNFNKKVDEVSLNSRFTLSHAVDKIKYKDDPELKPDYQKAQGHTIGQNYNAIPGQLMKSWDDIYMSTQLASGEESKRTGYYDVIDFNGDGNYNSSYDDVPWGYSDRPQNTYTLDLGAEYRGFRLSVQFYGQNNATRTVHLNSSNTSQTIWFKDRANVWSPNNPSGTQTYQAFSVKNATTNPLLDVYDASMFRLKMVELSYSFNKSMCDKLGLKSLRMFVNGNNLALWTDLPDDREYNGWNNYRGAYPNMKRVNVGFDLNF